MVTKTTQTLLLLSLLLTPPTVYSSDNGGLLGPDFDPIYDGEINVGGSETRDGISKADLRDSYITLGTVWKNKVKGVITAKIEELLEKRELDINDDFDVEEFIKHAYIKIREINNAPVAVIIGKQPIPFGQNVQEMPLFNNSPLSDLQEIDEVIGFTVELHQGLFGLFDMAELSAFETESGDLEIGKHSGYSIRLSKLVSDDFRFTLSHATQKQKGEDETRTSIGLIGMTPDGVMAGWVEGIYFSNNPQYLESEYGVTVGASMLIYPGTTVVVEYNHIENEIKELALGVRSKLTRRVAVGAEIRYREDQNGDDDVILGATLTYKFGNTPFSNYHDYLFKNDQSADEFLGDE